MKMEYKIYITDNTYTEWCFYEQEGMSIVELNINPIHSKLFTSDTITKDGTIVNSPIRNEDYLAGILILKGKTYGRNKNGNGKFYYKCIPNDKRLPAFLVPYEPKTSEFSKLITNKYILFKFVNWEQKHPIARIINNLGEVTNLSGFYEYQLYCKNLFYSLKEFTRDAHKANKLYGTNWQSNIIDKYKIKDRTDRYILSIDPKESTDLDDAISFDNNILSIYIANVPILLDYFELWDSFSQRVSTIYLPDRKVPMLPAILSENLCSLLENEERIAFCVDIHIENNKIIKTEMDTVVIKVKKNYIYDEEKLHKNEKYKEIFKICKDLNKNYKYVKDIQDSHHLVAYTMMLMNYECARVLENHKIGIYRTLKLFDKLEKNEHLADEIYNFIKIWQSASGQYTNFINKSSHELIGPGIDKYIHITSPIRRLVDLLNIIKIQEKLNLVKLDEKAYKFYSKWEDNLEYINVSMRAIRKIQTDCNMLNMCISNPKILEQNYLGYVFDKIERRNKLIQYTVYIPELKLVTRVNVKNEIENYSSCQFKLYLFQDGTTLKRKIKAELIL